MLNPGRRNLVIDVVFPESSIYKRENNYSIEAGCCDRPGAFGGTAPVHKWRILGNVGRMIRIRLKKIERYVCEICGAVYDYENAANSDIHKEDNKYSEVICIKFSVCIKFSDGQIKYYEYSR